MVTEQNGVILVAENWLTILGMVATLFGVTVSVVWGLAWWLSRQFTFLRNLIFTETKGIRDMLIEKLEYHEQHDDKRFADIRDNIGRVRDDLWEMRVTQAAKNTGFREKE